MTSTSSEREKTEETATWKSWCCYFKLELNKNYKFLEILNNTDELDQPVGDCSEIVKKK